jgi:hypothetical protein
MECENLNVIHGTDVYSDFDDLRPTVSLFGIDPAPLAHSSPGAFPAPP